MVTMAQPPIRQVCWGLAACLLLGLTIVPPVASCSLPTYLYDVYGWSAHVRLYGRSTDRQYDFDTSSMNVSLNNEETSQLYYKCHKAVGDDTFIMREIRANTTAYRCFRFEKWSRYVMRLWESNSETKSARSLCSDDQLTAYQWPLVWPHFDLGYAPCPAIGGYNMEVLDSQGTSFCEYIQTVPKPRFESECIQGEGMRFDFRLDICKRDIPLDRSATLYCLGHREVSGYTHVVVTDNKQWAPQIMMLRYKVVDDGIDMHLFGDIVLDFQEDMSRRNSHIRLKNTLFNDLCGDYHPNCLAPETCDPTNIINCQETCKNHTACMIDKEPCNFDPSTLGRWEERTSNGSRMITVGNHTAMLGHQGSFQCLNVYSTTSTGLKPVVQIQDNGCLPRYACLDLEKYSSNILKYRLSKSQRWPYESNIVRGDLCGQNAFKDAPFVGGANFHNQHYKVLIHESTASTDNRRNTVPCNLDGAMNFRIDSTCSGTLRGCQSGNALVMTFGGGCSHRSSTQRVFYHCLASFRTSIQKYIITQRTDDPGQIHCWVRRVDRTGVLQNAMVKVHVSECTNGSLVPQTREGRQHIMRLEYDSGDIQDGNSDSCLDMPSPTVPPQTTDLSTQNQNTPDVTLAPTAYKNIINTTDIVLETSRKVTSDQAQTLSQFTKDAMDGTTPAIPETTGLSTQNQKTPDVTLAPTAYKNIINTTDIVLETSRKVTSDQAQTLSQFTKDAMDGTTPAMPETTSATNVTQLHDISLSTASDSWQIGTNGTMESKPTKALNKGDNAVNGISASVYASSSGLISTDLVSLSTLLLMYLFI